MALRLNDKYVKDFVSEAELASIQSEISAAHKTLLTGSGEGSDFLGWVDLPRLGRPSEQLRQGRICKN